MTTLLQTTGSAHAGILGIGGYRPERVVPNAEIVGAIDSSDEWVRSRSGIESRHRAAPNESVVDMAHAASVQALEQAGVEAGQLGAILLATVTHPFQTPSAASALAGRLSTMAAAMDLSAACAGYCHGIALAESMVRAGTARYVLVVGVEKLSDFTDPTDRGSAFIFGDGAGAAVVGPSDEPGIGPTVWASDGSQWDLIRSSRSWVQLRDDHAAGRVEPGQMPWSWMAMQGPSVFRWAVSRMPALARQALDAAGVSVEDLGAFVPHQANLRIVDALVKALRIPAHVAVADDVRTSANTSSASIPLATQRLLADGAASGGDLALQIGFGAGLSFAAQVVRLP